jgi:nicotinamide mononucleotide (NMN) deamidase PncC
MDNIIEILKLKRLTLSSCESITGGGFANYITNIPGASSVYKGGLVT